MNHLEVVTYAVASLFNLIGWHFILIDRQKRSLLQLFSLKENNQKFEVTKVTLLKI